MDSKPHTRASKWTMSKQVKPKTTKHRRKFCKYKREFDRLVSSTKIFCSLKDIVKKKSQPAD